MARDVHVQSALGSRYDVVLQGHVMTEDPNPSIQKLARKLKTRRRWAFSNEKVNKSVDSINKIVQTLAIVIAGIWAYKSFFESVKPGLEFRGKVTTDLDWSLMTDETVCKAQFGATITNDGIRPFDVSDVNVRAWFYRIGDRPPAASDENEKIAVIAAPTINTPTLVEENAVENFTPFFNFETSDEQESVLIGHFPPQGGAHKTWSWFFKKEPERGVIFRVDFRTKDNTAGYAWSTDEICGEPEKKTEEKASTEKSQKTTK